jgi:pimeloyl-ACP methyl ester carboxylesterase
MDRRAFLAGCAVLGLAAPARAYNSARLSVQVKGEGRDVILIPGLTNGRDVWDGTVRAIPGYRYHLVQVAGFAGDPARGNAKGEIVAPLAAEIARYITEAGLKSPAIIGHSMGGVIALMLSARFPARVGRAMTIDILPAPASGFGFAGTQVKPFADALFDAFSGSAQGRLFLDGLIDGVTGTGVQRSRSDSAVVARATHELATLDLTPELPRIRAPFTVVYAVPDDATDAAAIDRLYRTSYATLKSARMRRIAGSGHMVMFDQPQRFYADVKAFLA